jgi:hypothetical protein
MTDPFVPRGVAPHNDLAHVSGATDTELPMAITGKAQKFVMREQMIEKLKLSEGRSA